MIEILWCWDPRKWEISFHTDENASYSPSEWLLIVGPLAIHWRPVE